MLTLEALINRLNNEEKELEKTTSKILEKQKFYDISKKREFKEIEIPTVYGLEKVPAFMKYRIEVEAQGYVLDANEKIVPLNHHTFDLYVLRNYPFPSERKLGAPIRIVWITPIFHPNIAPGKDYGGTGVICWRALVKWTTTLSLLNVVEGVKLLIENPDVDDPIHNPPICMRAAEYFRLNPPPKIVRKRGGRNDEK